MTFLAPTLLALGAAALVPLLLHLLQRHQGPRLTFPALRYLRRAEREHATRIRLRQVLLLALRILALVLLAAAAARPFLRGVGEDHSPTAVVMVLDNSLSSGAVVGDRRVLDALKEAALETLSAARVDDRIWLLRAGTPWEPAVTGSATMVADAIRRTEPSAAASDIATEIQRARSIIDMESEGRGGEVHLLSDLQATAFGTPLQPADTDNGGAPFVVVYALSASPPANRGVAEIELGSGLPPRAGQRSTIAIGLADTEAGADSVQVRLVLEGSVRAAGWVRTGATAVLPFPARPAGLAAGFVEIDPDALRADDRRYFVTEVSSPAAVAVAGPHPFLDEAMTVLEEAGRVRRAAISTAGVVLAPAARSADAVRRGASVVVMPPASPLQLAATNQRLAAAGIPWRYDPPEDGESRLDPEGSALSTAVAAWLPDIRLRQVYGLTGLGEGAGDSVALRLDDGAPWAVTGRVVDGGRFLVLASPLTVEGGTIATSAAMVPFVDEIITRWAEDARDDGARAPGALITVAGDSLAGPEGVEAVAGGSVVRLQVPGIYRDISAGDTLAAYAVNPPREESSLDRIPTDRVEAYMPGLDVTVAGPGGWAHAVFRDRVGREISAWLLVAALLLLVLEMAASASGRVGPRRGSQPAAATAPTGPQGR